MSESISVKRKRASRPSKGTEPFYGVRMTNDLMGRIQKWAAENSAASRSEAIRRLVELGLKAKK
jgi:Ribbon-helix-helix protein, copG family